MNPYTKALLFVLRLAAFGMVASSCVYLLSYIFLAVGREKSGESMFSLVLKGVPLVLGIFLWIKSYSIARKLTEDFDD